MSERRCRVDRYVDACVAMSQAALLSLPLVTVGALSSVGTPATAQGDLYFSYVGYGPITTKYKAIFIDVDYAPGTVKVKYAYGVSFGGDFTGYASYEMQLITGPFGLTIYANPIDGKTLFLVGADGVYDFTYPFKLAEGYKIDTSSLLVYGDGSHYNEISDYNTYWFPAKGVPLSTSGIVGFALYEGATATITFGSIYLPMVYEYYSVTKWSTGFVQWDSTATFIIAGTSVPEPGSWALAGLAAGAAGLGAWRRRRRKEQL